MTSAPAHTVRMGFFEWIHTIPRGKRGSRTVQAINACPPGMDALAPYFIGLQARQLASCWVALVFDATNVGDDWRSADLLRALVVVSIRLNQLCFPEEVLVMPKGFSISADSDAAPFAPPIDQTSPVPAVIVPLVSRHGVRGRPPDPELFGRLMNVGEQPEEFPCIRRGRLVKMLARVSLEGGPEIDFTRRRRGGPWIISRKEAAP